MTNAAGVNTAGTREAALAWGALLVFETFAQTSLKAGGDTLSELPFGGAWLIAAISNPWVLAGILGYLGSFGAWMVLLNRMPLSASFPLTAAVILSVVLASAFFFGETITPWRMAGLVLIIAGVTLAGRGDL